MKELVDVGITILGPNPGATLLLFFLSGLLAWAYWKEKKNGDAVAAERLKEAREDTEMVLSALNDATTAIKDYKSTVDTLKVTIEGMSKAVDRCHDFRSP
jgi:hypothetical protein